MIATFCDFSIRSIVYNQLTCLREKEKFHGVVGDTYT